MDVKPIFIVLGMHKSGTSWLAQKLSEADISMIDHHAIDASFEYRYGGKFERMTTKNINEYILNCKGVNSIKISSKLTDSRLPKAKELVKALEKKYDGVCWGFKDPRTLFTINFWLENLGGQSVIMIGIFRDPYHVALRYGRRNVFKVYHALKMWIQMNEVLLQLCRSRDVALLNFDKIRLDGGAKALCVGGKSIEIDFASISTELKGHKRIRTFLTKIVDRIFFRGRARELHLDLMKVSG